MKILRFKSRGEIFLVNKKGQIIQEERIRNKNGDLRISDNDFSEYWVLLGVAHHHMNNRPKIWFEEIWKNPDLMRKGYVWDLDHGSVRRWGGHNPKCEWAEFVNIKIK